MATKVKTRRLAGIGPTLAYFLLSVEVARIKVLASKFMEAIMRVEKWGSGLAVRLPAGVVDEQYRGRLPADFNFERETPGGSGNGE
ncbi:hypothetical protein LJ656_24715 [Paraburkholderia sp. MMS20-SJTR3]|uniref:SpoVT-AbrB domain-containing protein n=1 Tax=Paraburkholderia sejongensis TaxID=2886946 RepID=A0ABS8K0W1_9BURK|nr:hypothetical protein [Paraburkholderia sp. MMS20-SJTR3]MCC8395791.1 hypothetical protein [Paraburkholderia sp. MMS20-SJTR3]